MENVYSSPKYQEIRKRYSWLLDSKYFKEEEVTEISSGHILKKTLYTDGEKYIKDCSVWEDGELLFEYQTLDDNGDFIEFFRNSESGRRYFIFREDLYGYSLYSQDERKFYRYFPEKVLKGEEDYIWAGFYYDEKHSLAIIESCIWACPYTLLLVDLKNPMQENPYFDLYGAVSDDDEFRELTFLGFNDEGIAVKIERDSGFEDVVLSYESCLDWYERMHRVKR